MKRFYVIAVALVAFAAVGLYAQQGAPPSAAQDVKNAYNNIKNNIMKEADKMPEEAYGLKPAPEERNFGGWVAHVADSQMGTCSGMMGERKDIKAGDMTKKADLTAALKQSFDACDAAYNALTDANAMEMVSAGRGMRMRLSVLWGNVSHDNECYGSMAVYLRLKGIVPPSTEAQAARGGR